MDNTGLPSQSQEDEDSEWEYEQHPTETEDFYFTLDLSHSPGNVFRDKQKATSTSGTSTKPVLQSVTIPETSPTADYDEPTTLESSETVEILDLHKPNPIISYRSKIYSCEWGRAIGTDVFFSQSQATTNNGRQWPGGVDGTGNEQTEPLVQGDGWDLIAKTSTKLVGHAVRAVPRDGKYDAGKVTVQFRSSSKNSTAPTSDKPPDSSPKQSSNSKKRKIQPQTEQNDISLDHDPQTPSGPVTVPLGFSATYEKQSQARFLERLIAAKQSRGETDRVFLGKSRTYEDGAKEYPTEELL